MRKFEKAKWIWVSPEGGKNEYAEFYESINYDGKKVTVHFSVSGEYTLFVNGKYVSSVQYADFEHYKVYESIDITEYLVGGENTVAFLACYWGVSGMRYSTPTPGIIFEIESDDEIIAFSHENTPSRKSLCYESGWESVISSQLGYSFFYDSTKQDGWLLGKAEGFGKPFVIEKECSFVQRPIKRQLVEQIKYAKPCGEKKNCIFDLGEEYAGFCSFSIKSSTEQHIKVYYGELLKDGHVKKQIGNRTFCFDYKMSKGENVFVNYMLRLACRFIEIECEDELEVEYIGILPQVYPTTVRKAEFDDRLDADIYNICLNTLKLSMLEHYVDCPWREQCLYAFDSRNQMLTGYYAYEGGNSEYARANLMLMSKDRRGDGLMSICFPSADDLTIPSFCLYYVLAVKEYILYTGDLSLAESVIEKIESVLKVFVNNSENNLVCRFADKSHWNFYDWSEYASGVLHESESQEPDSLINLIFVIALKSYDVICKKLGRNNKFEGLSEDIQKALNEKFYNEKTGLYFVKDPDENPTELVNCLAVYTGTASDKVSSFVCDKLASGELVECSLSMKCFKYDALLMQDMEKYKNSVLSEIRKTYKNMLDAGSTTVWETAVGESDFHSAASLCHGWSAIPICYYHRLGMVK